MLKFGRATGGLTSLLRRLGLVSRPVAGMEQAVVGSEPAQLAPRLWECLFPGEAFSQDKAHQLASRLRDVAAGLDGAQETAGAQHQEAGEQPRGKRRRQQRQDRPSELDFASYQHRYVALELLYVGHAYDGFARQATTDATIEAHLFNALRRTRLIPPEAEATWQELRYSRGGRTDKGVSALGQVVALLVRSAARTGQPQLPPERDMDYPSLLNRVLPDDIRVLGWTDAPEDFSARFSAQYREYKYLLVQPQEGGRPLDLERMRAAAAHFVGEHDFRHFCKVDTSHVISFERKVLDFRIEEVAGCQLRARRLLELHIRGTAFLWHQVRCMAAVLVMVGLGDEEPDIVATLLDVVHTPCKPQYLLASDEPLLLYGCAYGGLTFRRGAANYAAVRAQLEVMLQSHLVRAGMLAAIQRKLEGDELAEGRGGAATGGAAAGAVAAGGGGRRHVPLMLRPREPHLEERLLRGPAGKGPLVSSLSGGGSEGGGGAAPANNVVQFSRAALQQESLPL